MTGINCILDYAKYHGSITAKDITSEYGMKLTTARQHLSRLSSNGNLVRIGYGVYALRDSSEEFPMQTTPEADAIYNELHALLPLADFCTYPGCVYEPLQHHLSINHATYVETNRDTVESVFSILKDKYDNVYLQPDMDFTRKYIDLRKDCIIIKPLVTEAPVSTVNGIPVPTLEKLLVDILKDPDLEYLRGMEYQYMLETALKQYRMSISKLFRYARRRGVYDKIKSQIDTISNSYND
ncbi:MAG: hypothetical protein NC206_04375 [Bacteroides sp.]|nr:hypothetical protein [Roseburia sp.]MCM1346300.1 hypothetical protein [Bacteroides sp.]MCM1420811.1 hypothetical protein [Bacteroides sp.]